MADLQRVLRGRDSRQANRLPVSLAARITWKDASGAVRFASVVTKDVSDAGVFVECDAAAAIPLYRLVHLQIERSVGDSESVPKSCTLWPRSFNSAFNSSFILNPP